MRLATHSQRLSNWLSPSQIDHLVGSVKDWYGPPIAVAHVPGEVYISRGGDFRGHIDAGSEASLVDKVYDTAKRMDRKRRLAWERFMRKQLAGTQLHAFSSLADLLAEFSGGKGQLLNFSKSGTTGVIGATNSLWRVGSMPAAGAAAGAAPGGTVPTKATLGAMDFFNPTAPDTNHFLSAFPTSHVLGNTLLMYDRIFQVNKTMNSTAAENVTGVPTRYQASSGDGSSAGNFMFVECQTVLPATAHNWTASYLDQGGAAGAMPSLAGNASNLVNRLDHPLSQWFAPLAAGDTGVRTLTQMTCSAAVATGVIAFVIGHPIAFFPCPVANLVIPVDGITSAFQLQRIFDDAALGFLEITKPSTTATRYTGTVVIGAG